MTVGLPNLKDVGGNLDVSGQIGQTFPSLEFVGGDFVVIGTKMQALPPNIRTIGGNVIFSDKEPSSFVTDAKRAKKEGIIRGNIWCLITVEE